MYITCPNCGTAYNVDGRSISASGRAVRCFNCDHSWHQFPVAAQPVSGTSSARYAVPPPPMPPVRCRHKRTPEFTGIFTAIRLKRLCRIQFILVLFRRSRRVRQNPQRCRNSLWALFLGPASNPILSQRQAWITTSKTSRLLNPMMILDRNRMGKVWQFAQR